MDVFKLEQGLGLGRSARAPSPDVSFDAGSEFNLSFFDPPEDSVGFSDPGSVGSTTPASPPPARPLHAPLSAPLVKQEPQQYALADSSAASSKTFVPCKVCGDKASGYHYGVTSCEGCKGFFRRSIQKMIEYRCLRDGKCLVIRLNRNRCQFCRFKKCLAVGMSRDSVRYGRVPKRSRERISEQAAHCSTTAEVVEDSEPTSSTLKLIRNVTAAHRADCSNNDDFDGLDRKVGTPEEAVPFELGLAAFPGPLDAPDSSEKHRLWLWQHLAARVTPAVQRVVEFAKRVPGFSDFSQDDQLILIKMGFFEVWLSHTARQSAEGTLTFDDGSYFTHPQLEAMYDSQFATAVLHFMNSIGSLALTEPEIGIFSAAVLVTGERNGVMDPKGKQVHHDRLVEAFQIQIAHKGCGGTAIALLRELRVIGLRHAEHLEWPRTNWRGLRLPPLFAEIFDIPKIDVD